MPDKPKAVRPDPNEKQPDPTKKNVEDLDIRTDQANKVKGGLGRTGDPCDGGE